MVDLIILPMVLGVVTRGPSIHHPNAYDMSCIPGAPVYATHSGIATHSRSYERGRTVTVSGQSHTTSYSHLMAATSIDGGAVARGDMIGRCGNTGAYSTGPHLHYELIEGDWPQVGITQHITQ